jgi:site-specific recombinase XerD
MLNLYRRHVRDCPHRAKGREHTKCSCPIWADGLLDGKRCLRSLKTRDWQRAIRIAERLERPNSERTDLNPCAQPGCPARVEHGRCQEHQKSMSAAIASFHGATSDIANSTKRKNKRVLQSLAEFMAARGASLVHEVSPQLLYEFRNQREVSTLTWSKELGILRHFFRFCCDCKWTFENPAKQVAMPKNLKPADREPYTPNEVIKILAACDAIGRGPYERLRARAMVLLLRHTALRISDAVALARDRIRDGEIHLRTAKNGKPVMLPLHPDLKAALDALPAPRGAGVACPYFFWSGHGSSVVRDVTRTLTTAFRASGVPGACAHRFRHTMATELLGMGATFEEVADILGDTAAIVRKHYAKWSQRRQERISALMRSIFDTNLIHEKTHPVTQ